MNHTSGDHEFTIGAKAIYTDENTPEVSFLADAVRLNGADNVIESHLHLAMSEDYTAQIRASASGGILIGAFRVPQIAIPYQSDPTAASLRDALVAAGYMAAEEI